MSEYVVSFKEKKITHPKRGGELYLSFGKSFMDFICSLSALLILSPMLLIVAILIKLESKGPVFFRQDRVGKHGKIFKIFKFRSMTAMDNGSVVKQAQKNDARITKVGAFLRKSSIDELPQLINVLLGDMSLVGPRPHAVAHDKEFARENPSYIDRYHVLPGITGYAQVKGFRGETDTKPKLLGRIKYDVKYVQKISLLLDIKILFKTVWVVLRPQNAY